MRIDVQTAGLEKFAERLDKFPAATQRAATLTINAAARKARTMADREIRKQVSLSKAYLKGTLWIKRHATEQNLKAVITARERPTSLVRYGAKQVYRTGKRKAKVRGGISVQVKKGGRRRKIPQAFFISLKQGKVQGGNLGIAVRSTEGLNLKRVKASPESAGVHTLYGPSVDQVFNDVRKAIAPDVTAYLTQEFNRQFARLL